MFEYSVPSAEVMLYPGKQKCATTAHHVMCTEPRRTREANRIVRGEGADGVHQGSVIGEYERGSGRVGRRLVGRCSSRCDPEAKSLGVGVDFT